MRMLALPDTCDVCCVCMPVLSVSNILILPGCITAFSSNSPATIVSIRVGMFLIFRLLRVEETTFTSSNSSAEGSKNISIISSCGKLIFFSIAVKPIELKTIVCFPLGIFFNSANPLVSEIVPF